MSKTEAALRAERMQLLDVAEMAPLSAFQMARLRQLDRELGPVPTKETAKYRRGLRLLDEARALMGDQEFERYCRGVTL